MIENIFTGCHVPAKPTVRIILESFEHPEENFFYDLYREHYLPEILKEDIDILGISITSVEQVIPGLSLAHLVKKERPEIHITVGGSIFTKRFR